jgi:hypothetical protein
MEILHLVVDQHHGSSRPQLHTYRAFVFQDYFRCIRRVVVVVAREFAIQMVRITA